MMIKYRRLPIIVEAIEYKGENISEIIKFINGKTRVIRHSSNIFLETSRGEMEFLIGDYIIKGIEGEFYPCKSETFKKTYEVENE